MNPKRICLWSGPRNVSTALMYSFAQRPDTKVVDEPLYAHYLRVSGAIHPMRAEILQAQNPDGEAVIQKLVYEPSPAPVLFMKHMAHHLVELDWAFMADTINVLLIRDPEEVLISFSKVIENPVLRDIGIKKQADLYEYLCGLGQQPVVLDGKDVRNHPEAVLKALCIRLELPFYEQMLNWKPGAIEEDGVWAPHWYTAVHKSTGFQPWKASTRTLPGFLSSLNAEAQPYYSVLRKEVLTFQPS